MTYEIQVCGWNEFQLHIVDTWVGFETVLVDINTPWNKYLYFVKINKINLDFCNV